MTMFTLPNFCRVCLKYDKNLIDLAHIENEPSETLLSKLQLCVSEVEWNVFKPLLCHPCIKRLNIAYGFKKQCVQSASVLKNYAQIVKDTQKKNESPTAVKTDGVQQLNSYMILPNQKYVKILVGTQNQSGANSFQNVFLNLIPTTTLTSTTTPTTTDSTPKSKDTNQNVFLNINNTFQKFIPIAPNEAAKKVEQLKQGSVNVNQLLTESKTEELSVELDPLDFTGLEDDRDDDDRDSDEDNPNDWDEVISQSKIDSKKEENGLNGNKTLLKHNNYVPILPKQQEEFFNSGQHFLSPTFDKTGEFACERCSKNFPTLVRLKNHIKMFHLGKLPFKCDVCYVEYVLRSQYELCLRTHNQNSENPNTSLTLQDFANTSNPPMTAADVSEEDLKPTDSGDYVCDICRRLFNSSTGLLRHKVRKHNQKNKKKYFIKGVKNAKCDICNREFSTQSYMQLHRKLHMRDDIGYKYKVFGKSKYRMSGEDENTEGSQENVKQESEKVPESINVTPDIFIQEEDSDSQEHSSDPLKNNSFENAEKDTKEEDNDPDEDRLRMDIENGEQSENENNDEDEEAMSEEN